jgi:hypothetical protein
MFDEGLYISKYLPVPPPLPSAYSEKKIFSIIGV